MRKVFYLFLFFGMLSELKAQGTVTFQENIFNNNSYKIDGREANREEVALLMTDYESSLKDFVEGNKQMRIGSWLGLIGTAGIIGGFVYFAKEDFLQNALDNYLIISVSGAAILFISRPIRMKGKQRVETSVSEYNYLKERNLDKTINLSFNQGKIGLVYTF